MKKTVLAIAIAFGALNVRADVVTNYSYVVSNIFNNVYSESIITQKVKSTHTNYYFTNYVSVVTNVYQTTFKTNIEVNVIFDNFEPWVLAASNHAANASSFASDSAASATAASSSASSANSAASRAAASASSAASAASDGLNRINERIQWFDEHSGETITVIENNTNITINTYFPNLETNLITSSGSARREAIASLPRFGIMTLGGTNFTLKVKVSSTTTTTLVFDSLRFDGEDYRVHMKAPGDKRIWAAGSGASSTDLYLDDMYYTGTAWVMCLRRQYNGGAYTVEATAPFLPTSRITMPSPGSSYLTIYLDSNGSYTDYEKVDAIATASLIHGAVDAGVNALADEVSTELTALTDMVASLSNQWNDVSAQWTAFQDQAAALSNQWSDISAQWTAFQGAVSEGLADLSNHVANAENGYPHAYTSPGGTTYNNIVYYDRATDDGKVAITTVGDYYPSLEYRVVPNYGGRATAGYATDYWIFEPAYVDTDANGLRLHYLPKQEKTITATTYNAGYNYVPRDFYWQDGVVYVVIDSYNGTTWSGRIRLKYVGTGADAWPCGLLADQQGSSITGMQYRYMSFDSREGTIMGSSTSATFAYLKTEYQKVMPSYDSVLWFPESPSVAQQAIVSWLATWTR